MKPVILNEDEARTLYAIIDGVIMEAIAEQDHKETVEDDDLNYLGDLFSIRKKCMEVVFDG